MKDIIAAIIAIIHVYIFYLESIAWGRPKTNKNFRVSNEDAKACGVFAFNQGFYNLFLSIAIATGLICLQLEHLSEGRTLIDYAVASVLGAGTVLFISSPRLKRAAAVQIIPALIYLVLRII